MGNINKPFISLRVKAILLALAAGILITSLSNMYLSGKAEELLYRYKIERMDALGRIFASNAEYGRLLQNRAVAEKLCYGVNQEPDVLFALVLDRDLNIAAGNYGGIPQKYFPYIRDLLRSQDMSAIASGSNLVQKDPFDENETIIRPIFSSKMQPTVGAGFIDEEKDQDRQVVGYSVIVFSLKSLAAAIHKVRIAIAFLSGAALILMVGVFYALVTMLIRNLDRLLGAAEKLGKGDLSTRVDIRSHDEVERLGDGFNIMASELEGKNRELQDAMERLQQASTETIYRLSLAAEYRDWDTGSHLLRMSHYAKALARKMNLEPKYTEAILYASLMHDVGKIGIPDRILRKPGKLTSEEWEIMKKHTVIGAQILQKSEAEFIKLAETIALSHHEKWDGSGYPRGLKGTEISLAGRIVAVADVFEAVTSKRPYKESFPVEKAFEIIEQGRGYHFDPDVVDAFFAIKDEILDIKKKQYHDETQEIKYES